MKFLAFVLSFALLEQFVNPANILCVFPKPAFSHQHVFRAVTGKLLENGHRITLLSTHPTEDERNHENVTLIDVSFSVKLFQGFLNRLYEGKHKGMKNAIFEMIDSEALIVDKQMSSAGMQALLNDPSATFDLLLLETSGVSPMHALAEHFQIPVVGISSADSFSAVHEVMGNVVNPVAHPDRILPFAIAKTFKQRLGSSFFALMMNFVFIPRSAKHFDKIVGKYFPNVTKTHFELVGNVDIQLVNAHPALGYNRPILSNTIQLGFLHIKPPKALPEDLMTILENSKHGVIYMSFGTVVITSLMEKNLASFMQAFAALPYEVLWKFDRELTDGVPPNVHLRKWFPQSDILAHKNVKLFITHGVSVKLSGRFKRKMVND